MLLHAVDQAVLALQTACCRHAPGTMGKLLVAQARNTIIALPCLQPYSMCCVTDGGAVDKETVWGLLVGVD